MAVERDINGLEFTYENKDELFFEPDPNQLEPIEDEDINAMFSIRLVEPTALAALFRLQLQKQAHLIHQQQQQHLLQLTQMLKDETEQEDINWVKWPYGLI